MSVVPADTAKATRYPTRAGTMLRWTVARLRARMKRSFGGAVGE